MIKNNTKIILTFMLLMLFIGTKNINADTYNSSAVSKPTNIQWRDQNGNWHDYKHYEFTISRNGNSFKAYCIDPSYTLLPVNCDALGDDKRSRRMYYLYEHMIQAQADDITRLLAVRMLERLDLGTQKGKDVGAAISKYVFNRKECEGSNGANQSACKAYKEESLRGDERRINKAYELAIEAYNNGPKSSALVAVSSKAKIEFKVQSSKENKVVLSVESTNGVNVVSSEIDFVCGNNCTVTKKTWDGKKGTVEIELKPSKNVGLSNCQYTVKAYLNKMNEMIWCTAKNAQTLIAKVPIMISTVEIGKNVIIADSNLAATFKGSVTQKDGGTYYQNYCDSGVKKNICKFDSATGKYYGKDGREVDEATYNLECRVCSFDSATGKYYGIDGREVDEATYHAECDNTTIHRPCEIVKDANGNPIEYYDQNGNLTDEATYNQQCGTPNPPPNVCTQKTVTKMPTLCDVGTNDAYIKVTNPDNPDEPTDVKNCILNNKDDVGNSYQMLDGQVKKDNPYCSVYCKEDYEMSLPGAQYTTSGRFFMLDNAKVNATRTCYATGGTNGTEYIDIDAFKKDVEQKQRAVITAYNDYAKSKARYESAKDPANTDTTEVTSSRAAVSAHCSNPLYSTEASCKQHNASWNGAQSACSDTKNQNKVTGKTIAYTTYNITGVNASGQLNLNPVTQSLSANYGYSLSAASDCKFSETQFGDYKELSGYETEMNQKKAVLTQALQDLNTTLDHMEDCYDWKNNLCLDPELEFDYNESYNTKINYTRVDGSNETIVGEEATYSNQKTIDNEYTTPITNQVNKIGYLVCDDSGCGNTNEKTISLEYYFRKIETKGVAEYANAQQFQTNYPHGTIDTVVDQSKLKYNYSYLGAVFPVALTTDKGVYQWTLNMSKLGMYNDEANCRLGRFDEIIQDAGGTTSTDLEYVCVYVVDCDDCEFTCVGPGCLIEDQPSCPECDVFCDNCIFAGKNTFFFREITVNDTNPAKRPLGSNLTTDKGQQTLAEIEATGEDVYINADYTFKMTPENMKAIRDHNTKMDTYVEEELDYKVQNNITNAFGESKFLTDGVKNGFFKSATMNRNFTLWPGAITSNTGPAWKVGS